jgi:hypothetical protein
VSSPPSVGHPVHYVAYGTPGGEYQSVCRHAVVTEVGAWVNVAYEDETVGGFGQRARTVIQNYQEETCAVVVFNPTGQFFNTVRHDEERTPGTWHYPCARQSLTGVVQPDGSTITAEENPE